MMRCWRFHWSPLTMKSPDPNSLFHRGTTLPTLRYVSWIVILGANSCLARSGSVIHLVWVRAVWGCACVRTCSCCHVRSSIPVMSTALSLFVPSQLPIPESTDRHLVMLPQTHKIGLWRAHTTTPRCLRGAARVCRANINGWLRSARMCPKGNETGTCHIGDVLSCLASGNGAVKVRRILPWNEEGDTVTRSRAPSHKVRYMCGRK